MVKPMLTLQQATEVRAAAQLQLHGGCLTTMAVKVYPDPCLDRVILNCGGGEGSPAPAALVMAPAYAKVLAELLLAVAFGIDPEPSAVSVSARSAEAADREAELRPCADERVRRLGGDC